MGCEVSQQNASKAEIPTHRYQQKQLKAKGTHATVYRVYDTTNKQDYAQKIIQKFPAISNLQQIHPDFQDYFNKLTSLKHENLVSYSDIFFNDGKLSIVMSLSEQGTLLQEIESKGKLNQFQSAKIVRKVLTGLQYLHNQGLLHNDLKPSNILLFQNGVVKISDYCTAQLFDSRLLKSKSKQQGNNKWDNVPYMAPQIVKNLGTSRLADVWSVGCILIQMLTGKKPWSSFGSPEQLFKKIASVAVPPLPPDISSTCTSFLENCLAIVPSQRSSVSQLLNHPFLLLKKEQKGDTVATKKKERYPHSELKPGQSSNLSDFRHLSVNNTIDSEPSPIFDRKSLGTSLKKQRQAKKFDGMLTKINKNTQTQAIGQAKDKNTKKNYQIVEYEHLNEPQQENTVILNNRKVKLSKQFYKNPNPQRFSTDATEWTSPSRVRMKEMRQSRRKLSKFGEKDQLDVFMANSSGLTDNSRLILPEITPAELSRMRMKTQNHAQFNREYYKRPLQLLKQKIQERREHRKFEQRLQERIQTQFRKHSVAQQNHSDLQQEQLSEKDQSEVNYEYSKSNREQAIIDTEVARFERDIYEQNQKVMMQKRKQERLKWEQELKSGKEILKRQIPMRCYIKR